LTERDAPPRMDGSSAKDDPLLLVGIDSGWEGQGNGNPIMCRFVLQLGIHSSLLAKSFRNNWLRRHSALIRSWRIVEKSYIQTGK
jgi:hypothetical protein